MLTSAIVLGLAACWAQQTTRPVLVLTDRQAIQASGWSIAENGRLQVIDSPGAAGRQVETPLLIDVENAVAPPAPMGGTLVRVQLASGEIIRGRIEDSEAHASLRLTNAQFGEMRVPFAEIVSLSFGATDAGVVAGSSPAKPSCVILTNGDVVPGKILAVTAKKVTIDSDFGETDTEMNRVVAILMSEDSAPANSTARDRLVCILGDGQRWLADWMRHADEAGTIVLSRSGRDVEVPVAAIRQIVFPGVSVQTLTWSAPAKVETTPYLGGTVAVRVDDRQHQRPRVIGQRTFADGITAQPRSKVTWETSTGASYLLCWVGMDPARGANGICDVRVETEGRTLLSIERLTARDGPQRVAVPLTGLKSFTLVTDFGPRGEIGDWVNWCEMRIASRSTATSVTTSQ